MLFRSQTPAASVSYIKDIEIASRLKMSGLINNTHLCDETDISCVTESAEFAEQVSSICNIPIVFTSVKRDIAVSMNSNKFDNVYPIDIYTKKYW